MTETPNPHIDPDTLTGEMRPIRPAVLSLGSNVGDRLANLQGAIDAFADTPDVHVVTVSSVYETEPVDAPDGSHRTSSTPSCSPTRTLSVAMLLDRAQAVEAAFGRERGEPQRAAHARRRPDRRRRPTLRHRRADAAAPAGPRAGVRAGPVARDRRAGADPGPRQDRRPARRRRHQRRSSTGPISSSRSSRWPTSEQPGARAPVGPTRIRLLVALFVVGGVLGYALRARSRSSSSTGSAPRIQWTSVIVLLAAAAIVLVLANSTYRTVHRERRRMDAHRAVSS